MKKGADHLSLLASGCKTLAKQGSFAAVLLLSLHDSLESQTRDRNAECTSAMPKPDKIDALQPIVAANQGLWNARSAPSRESVLKITSIAAPSKKRPRLSAAEITGK